MITCCRADGTACQAISADELTACLRFKDGLFQLVDIKVGADNDGDQRLERQTTSIAFIASNSYAAQGNDGLLRTFAYSSC